MFVSKRTTQPLSFTGRQRAGRAQAKAKKTRLQTLRNRCGFKIFLGFSGNPLSTTNVSVFTFLSNLFTFLIFIQKAVLLASPLFLRYALFIFKNFVELSKSALLFRHIRFLTAGSFNIFKFLRRFEIMFTQKVFGLSVDFLSAGKISEFYGASRTKSKGGAHNSEMQFFKLLQNNFSLLEQIPAVTSYLLKIFTSTRI